MYNLTRTETNTSSTLDLFFYSIFLRFAVIASIYVFEVKVT